MTSPPANVAQRRFNRHHPCPICGGHSDMPSGQGVRCWGYIAAGGDYVRCMREELAGPIPQGPDGAFPHKLGGLCMCGVEHAPGPVPVPRVHQNGKAVNIFEYQTAIYEYEDVYGNLWEKGRFEPPGQRKQFLWRTKGASRWTGGAKMDEMLLYGRESLAYGDDELVYLVEGEKTCRSLLDRGAVAVCLAGGAENRNLGPCLEALHDRRVVLWRDNDRAGDAYMRYIAEQLEGHVRELQYVFWEASPEKGDAFDYFAGGGTDAGLEAMLRTDLPPLLERSPDVVVVEGPKPPKWPEPPGDLAFQGLLGEIVDAIDPHTEADRVAVLVQLLAAFGNAIGSSPHCQVGATRHGLKLFAVIVGDSSKARKGESWSPVRQLFQTALPDWTLNRITSGLASGEGLIWGVRDPIEKKEPLKEKGKVVGYQDVLVDAGVEDKRLLIFESEFARCLAVMERQGNTLSSVVRDAWDHGTLNTLTKNSPARASNSHISIICHITLEELRMRLLEAEAANGFGNRFIFALAKRSKELPEPDPFGGTKLNGLAIELRETVFWASEQGEIRRDPDAREAWRSIYSQLSEAKPGLAGKLTARSEAQVLRLSALFALFAHSDVVKTDHLYAALELWDYCERSIDYIFGSSTGNPLADAAYAALQASQRLTRTELYNVFGRHESSGRIASAMRELINKGLVRSYTEATGGRPIEYWEAIA